MQKKNLLFAAGLMLLAACSEDIQPGTSDNGGLNFTGEGEMLVELKFNNASGTRAEDDGFGGYEDGKGDESKVKDATFYFFKEGGAYLGSSGKITVADSDVTADTEIDYIENNVKVTVPGLVVDALHDSDDKVKVIVVLNRDNGFKEPISGQTYESFRTQVNTGNGTLSFMMTNSVYYTDNNNNNKPWTDTDFAQNIENSIGTVTKANVYEKGTTDEKKQVFTVYVERVCSKVTFAVNGANNSFNIKDAEDDTAVQGTITVKAWGLNILNTKYYPVKQLAAMFGYGVGDNNYSDWPASQAKWNNAGNFRSFWAVDPNYSGDGSYLTDFTKTPFSKLEDVTTGTNALYCLENTFSNKGQDQDETTSVVVLAQFLLNGATAPVNVVAYGSKGDIPVYYSENDFLQKALADKLKDTNYTVATATTTTEPREPLKVSDFELKAENSEETVLGPAASGTPATGTIGYKSELKIALKDGLTVYKADGNVKDKEKLITELTKDLSEYTVYVNGYCYYSVPIRHFAESEVPLMNSTDINKNSQLGRYGIVRNHVYNVNINSIKALGKPVTDNTPEVPEEPDDKFEFLMDASINVLSWAVRNQNVDL